MLTTCPHCQTSFRVAVEQLEHAEGRVRCGNCLQVFDGINSEIDYIPPSLPADDAALLRNRSAEPAPYPLLYLGFTNRQGEPRARRSFLPAEYLHGEHGRWLPPHSEMQVSLAIADPGQGAANYVARLESPN